MTTAPSDRGTTGDRQTPGPATTTGRTPGSSPPSSFQRFRRAYAGLMDDDPDAPLDDAAWRRFAAQAALFAHLEPKAAAALIRGAAAALRDAAGWFDALASPVRLLLAAMIVESGDQAAAFVRGFRSARALLRAHGLHHGGHHEVVAIALMRVAGRLAPITDADVRRLGEMHHALKRLHWWLTGRDDLPAAALLATLPVGADEVARRADAAYRRVAAAGFIPGNHLQTASHLLAATDDAPAATDRLLAIISALQERGQEVFGEHLPALALLATVAHVPAPRVVDVFLSIYDALATLPPAACTDADYALAADLAAIDLIDDGTLGRDAAIEALRRQRLMSAVLAADVPPPTVLDSLKVLGG